jgi:hypothetical protein
MEVRLRYIAIIKSYVSNEPLGYCPSGRAILCLDA